MKTKLKKEHVWDSQLVIYALVKKRVFLVAIFVTEL